MLNEFNCFLTCWKYTGSISSFMLMNLLGTRKPKLLIMKKILVCLILFSGLMGGAFAQATSTYTGKVSDETGQGIPFATITIKGTSKATSTNQDGNFSFTASENQVVEVTALGFAPTTVTLGSLKVLNVVLASQAQEMQEVIVSTGYGIRQTQRSTTSNVQVVSGEKLNLVRQTSVNSALAGKVAGIQIREQSGAKLGVSNDVRLRGEGGVGSSSLLYVVDGTIVNPNDINVDDIEDLTVLAGPTGAAIYGPQAQAGAVIITLKKGKRQAGKGFDINFGTQFNSVYVLPKYQDEYAGGASPDLIQFNYQPNMPTEWQALDGKYYHDYTDDASWGPKMTGQEYIPWYAWYPGHSGSFKTASLNPQPNNIKDFYDVSPVTTSNISFSSASDKHQFRISYTNQYRDGITPTTWLNKNTINIAGSLNLAKWLTVGVNVTYAGQRMKGDNNDGYSNNTTGAFNQWYHRDLEMDKLRELRGVLSPSLNGAAPVIGSWNKSNPNAYNPLNVASSYGGNYHYNAYTWLDNYDNRSNRDRVFGDIYALIKPHKDFSVKLTHRKNMNYVNSETKTFFILERSATQSGVRNGYSASQSQYQDDRLELLVSYDKQVRDFSIRVNAGGEMQKDATRQFSASTAQGLYIPDFFAITNSVNQPTWGNSRTFAGYHAIFGRANLAYKNFLYVDATIRQDKYSTLKVDDNAITVRSFGAGFVFSEFLQEQLPWLSHGKVKFSFGETPQTLGAYAIAQTYSLATTRYGDRQLMSEPNTIIDPAIRGARESLTEFGLDLKFFKNRFGISATYYEGLTLNSPISVSISGATGYSSQRINTGRIERSGLEFNVFLNPISTADFRWEVNFNFAKILNNKVVDLADGLNQLNFSAGSRFTNHTPIVTHYKGEQWGILQGGGRLMDSATGLPVVTASGNYVMQANKRFGSVLPDFTGGLQNTFSYKNFMLNVNMDFQKGGQFFSLTQQWGAYSGLLARTVGQNDKGVDIREDVANGGGVKVVGVTTAGDKVETYVDAQTYFHNLFGNNIYDDFINDLTYFKVRELSLAYRVPVKKFGFTKNLTSLVVSAIATNPWLINAGKRDFDPSEITGTYGESGQMPSTRAFGFNVRVGF
jgi:TonB-linked SusC/RagA family outer membrane protein